MYLRLIGIAVIVMTAALAAAPASLASDASLKNVVLGEVDDLVHADAAVAGSLRALDRTKQSTRHALAAVHDARVVARRVAREAKAEVPSSQNGELAKQKLLRALKTEDRAMSKLAAGLSARLAGDRAKARRLLAGGQRELDRAATQGARAGTLIRALPSR